MWCHMTHNSSILSPDPLNVNRSQSGSEGSILGLMSHFECCFARALQVIHRPPDRQHQIHPILRNAPCGIMPPITLKDSPTLLWSASKMAFALEWTALAFILMRCLGSLDSFSLPSESILSVRLLFSVFLRGLLSGTVGDGFGQCRRTGIIKDWCDAQICTLQMIAVWRTFKFHTGNVSMVARFPDGK